MHRTILLLTTLAVLGGCSKSDNTNGKLAAAAWETISPTASDEPLGPPIDPCALLTSEEVQAVLGEPIQDVRRFCV